MTIQKYYLNSYHFSIYIQEGGLTYMRDKMKSFILANAFSVIMFIMCILLIFLTDYLAIGIGFSVLWLIYTIFANKAVLSGEKKKPIRETFHESNRKGLSQQRG
jgi:hypothetical protein